mmetsp:Transcript_14380/g.31474  ORF Transcript_14380/g.31474 Transcript_14380/m.31474 type:complete len:284 (+) Transcript_14380:1968-2819(+)
MVPASSLLKSTAVTVWMGAESSGSSDMLTATDSPSWASSSKNLAAAAAESSPASSKATSSSESCAGVGLERRLSLLFTLDSIPIPFCTSFLIMFTIAFLPPPKTCKIPSAVATRIASSSSPLPFHHNKSIGVPISGGNVVFSIEGSFKIPRATPSPLHSTTRPLTSAVATYFPSGEHATRVTVPVCAALPSDRNSFHLFPARRSERSRTSMPGPTGTIILDPDQHARSPLVAKSPSRATIESSSRTATSQSSAGSSVPDREKTTTRPSLPTEVRRTSAPKAGE